MRTLRGTASGATTACPRSTPPRRPQLRAAGRRRLAPFFGLPRRAHPRPRHRQWRDRGLAVEAGKNSRSPAPISPRSNRPRSSPNRATRQILSRQRRPSLPLPMPASTRRQPIWHRISDLALVAEAVRSLAPAVACASPATPPKAASPATPRPASPTPISCSASTSSRLPAAAPPTSMPASKPSPTARRTATDVAMLANVHQTLCDTDDHRRHELAATAAHLVEEIAAHRDRQAALARRRADHASKWRRSAQRWKRSA